MAIVGQMTHVRCKVMCRCVCARHCAVETDTQQGYRQRADNRQTNLGSHSIPIEVMSLSNDCQSCDHTIPRQQGNLRLTHFQCSQYVWSRNQGRVISIHAAESVTFAERVRMSRSPYEVHRSCEHCSQQRVCHKVGDTMVRTSRFTFLKIFLAYNPYSPSGHSLVGHNSSS